MEDPNKAVENQGGAAAATQQGVETKPGEGTAQDPEAVIAALTKRAEDAERDRDNYRTGLLVKKGKAGDEELDLTNPEHLKIYIDKKVQEKDHDAAAAAARKEVEAEALKLAKRNKELELALQSKNASTSMAGGSGAGSGAAANSETKTEYWSPEQKAELKKRGWTDDQINKAARVARDGAATGAIAGAK